MDIRSLMEHTASTGTVTTASYLFAPSVTGPVYDVPFTKGVPRIAPFGSDPATTDVVLPTGNFSAAQRGQNPATLGYHASSSLKKRDKAGTPTCLAKKLFREAVYIAIVRHTFDASESDVRELIIDELGGDRKTVYSLASKLAAEQLLPDCNVLEFTVKQLNRSPLQAALVLGDLLGLSPENVFEVFPVITTTSVNAGSIPVSCNLVPSNLMVDGKLYSLKYIDYQHDFSGNIDQAVCLYATAVGYLFIVIAARVMKNGMGVLTIGERAATAWPFSYTRMAQFPNAHIIFPMCKLTSLHLRRLWREAKQPESTFIISGQFGDSVALHLDSFRGHPVTLIPKFDRDGFQEILPFARRLLNAGVLSVSVYPWPIKAEGLPDEMFS